MFGLGAISERTHNRIVYSIPEARNEKHRTYCRRGNTKYIGVVVKKKNSKGLEKEVRGCIARAVTYLFI